MRVSLIVNVVGPSRCAGYEVEIPPHVWPSQGMYIELHDIGDAKPISRLRVAEYITYDINRDSVLAECVPIIAPDIASFDGMCAYLHGRGAVLLNSTDEGEFEGSMRDFLVDGRGLPVPNPHLNGGK